jgi:hypothetical protein
MLLFLNLLQNYSIFALIPLTIVSNNIKYRSLHLFYKKKGAKLILVALLPPETIFLLTNQLTITMLILDNQCN